MCRKSQSRPDIKRNDSISIIVHDFAVVGPIPAANMSLAKGLASERAKQVLGDETSPYLLSRICDCAEEAKREEAAAQEEALDGVEAKKLDLPSLSNHESFYNISYSDNGIGFEPEYNEKIFEVFQRLHSKDDYSGTGIGLAIVKKIIENHEGAIIASGNLNQGASFDMYIPAK